MNTTRKAPRTAQINPRPSKRGWLPIQNTAPRNGSVRDERQFDPVRHIDDDDLPPPTVRAQLDATVWHECGDQGVSLDEPAGRVLRMNAHGLIIRISGMDEYFRYSEVVTALEADGAECQLCGKLEFSGILCSVDKKPDGQIQLTLDFENAGYEVVFFESRLGNRRVKAQRIVIKKRRRGPGSKKGLPRTRKFAKNNWVLVAHS